ncbi:MAG: phosphoribosylformylglycinamidine synthase subunit PurQ [candidate division Zixibacteria bacterium]|nr:phosphoribosylformylglycinamidine synthase subunit PurQ [candidate division Zixibacteria bacterium]
MRFGVVTFPGSNCDYDAYAALKRVLCAPVEFLWHGDSDLKDVDCVILPGGFSFGDYLRPGAIARFSPVMKSVIRFAETGGLVWGICNGFQVLLEAELIPGAILRNESLRFACQWVRLRVDSNRTPYTRGTRPGDILRMPVAHADGAYYADDETLMDLETSGQVVFRYVNAEGIPDEKSNPNGSRRSIAGISNREGNVLGMMPHPERAVEPILGSEDGLTLFKSLLGTTATGVDSPLRKRVVSDRGV